MSATELLRAWLADLAAMTIVQAAERDAVARANMEFFAIATAQDEGMEPTALAAFLRDAYRAYAAAAARAGLDGWYYAWHDAQAGQLRMSVCPGASIAELPFDREVAVVDALALARDVLASTTAHGIPWSALVDTPPEPPGGDRDRGPVPVFARPLRLDPGA